MPQMMLLWLEMPAAALAPTLPSFPIFFLFEHWGAKPQLSISQFCSGFLEVTAGPSYDQSLMPDIVLPHQRVVAVKLLPRERAARIFHKYQGSEQGVLTPAQVQSCTHYFIRVCPALKSKAPPLLSHHHQSRRHPWPAVWGLHPAGPKWASSMRSSPPVQASRMPGDWLKAVSRNWRSSSSINW